MSRNDIIFFIKMNDSSYTFSDFSIYSNDELLELAKQIAQEGKFFWRALKEQEPVSQKPGDRCK